MPLNPPLLALLAPPDIHPLIAALLVALLVAGLVMPKWLLFLSTMALSHGMVSLGIVIQMRSGVVSFGQGFVFAAGGYATALAANHLGITDAILMVLVGGLAATLCALPFAPLLSRYRSIFFAMLTLAISMVLYGILVKTESLGGLMVSTSASRHFLANPSHPKTPIGCCTTWRSLWWV